MDDDKCLLDVISDPDALDSFLTKENPVLGQGPISAQQTTRTSLCSNKIVNNVQSSLSAAPQHQLIGTPMVAGAPIQFIQGTSHIGTAASTVSLGTSSQVQNIVQSSTTMPSLVGKSQLGQVQGQTIQIQGQTYFLQGAVQPGGNIQLANGQLPNLEVLNQSVDCGGNIVTVPKIVLQPVRIQGLGDVCLQTTPGTTSAVINTTNNFVSTAQQIAAPQLQFSNGTFVQVANGPGLQQNPGGAVLQPPVVSNAGDSVGASSNIGANIITIPTSQGSQQVMVQRSSTGQNIILKTVPNYVHIQPASRAQKLILPNTVQHIQSVPTNITNQAGKVNGTPVLTYANTNAASIVQSNAQSISLVSTGQGLSAPDAVNQPKFVTINNNPPPVQTIQLHITPKVQATLVDIQNKIKKLSAIQNPTEDTRKALTQLNDLQNQYILQARLQALQNSRPVASGATATSGGSIALPINPTNLTDLLKKNAAEPKSTVKTSFTSKPVSVTGEKAPASKLIAASTQQNNLNIVPTQFKIGDRIVTLAIAPENRAKIESQLAKLTPTQREVVLAQTERLAKQGGPHATRPQVPITIQQVGKGINQIRPLFPITATGSVPAAGSKRPIQVPSKQNLLAQTLEKDQMAILKPNTKFPFASYKDSITRLLRYHVYQEKEAYSSDFSRSDEMFATVSENLLKRSATMMDKYRDLLWEDSMKESHTEEMVMIDRMFIHDEQELLEGDKKFAAENPGEYDVSDVDVQNTGSDSDMVDVVGVNEDIKFDLKTYTPIVQLENIGCDVKRLKREQTDTMDDKPRLKLSIKREPKLSDTGESLMPFYSVKNKTNDRTEPDETTLNAPPMSDVHREVENGAFEPTQEETATVVDQMGYVNNFDSISDPEDTVDVEGDSNVVNGYVNPSTGVVEEAPDSDDSQDTAASANTSERKYEGSAVGDIAGSMEDSIGMSNTCSDPNDNSMDTRGFGESEIITDNQRSISEYSESTPGFGDYDFGSDSDNGGNPHNEEVQHAIDSILDLDNGFAGLNGCESLGIPNSGDLDLGSQTDFDRPSSIPVDNIDPGVETNEHGGLGMQDDLDAAVQSILM